MADHHSEYNEEKYPDHEEKKEEYK